MATPVVCQTCFVCLTYVYCKRRCPPRMKERFEEVYVTLRKFLMLKSVIASLGLGGFAVGIFGIIYITIPAWVLAALGLYAHKNYENELI